MNSGRGCKAETPESSFFFGGGQGGPILPTKIKVCGEPSWGVRESVCQIRVQTDERFRRLSHTHTQTHTQTHKQTNKQTNIQLPVYILVGKYRFSVGL